MLRLLVSLGDVLVQAVTFFERVSDNTLGSFWSLFSGLSVFHCHGVSLSGSHVFVCFVLLLGRIHVSETCVSDTEFVVICF